MEAEAFEGFVEVLGILEGWSLPIYHDLFALCTCLLKLDHAVISDLLLDLLRHFKLQTLYFLVSLLQKLVEDDFVHGPAVIITYFHQQAGAFHVLQSLSLRHILQSPLLLLVQLR